MSKLFDPSDIFIGHVKRQGHAFGEGLAASPLFAQLGVHVPDFLKKWADDFVLLAGSGVKIPRNFIPISGGSGDILHKYANEFLDATVLGIGQVMQEKGELSEADFAKVKKEAEAKVLTRKLIRDSQTRMVHEHKDCSLLTELMESLKSRLTTSEVTLEAVVREKMELCPRCNARNIQGAEAPKEETGPTKPAKNLPILIAHMMIKDKPHATAVWAFYQDAEPKVMRPKILRVLVDETSVMALKEYPRADWSQVIDTMIGGSSKFVDRILERLGSEGDELGRVVDQGAAAAKATAEAMAGYRETAAARYTAAKTKRQNVEQGLASERSWFWKGFFLFGIAAIIFLVATNI